MNNDTALVIIDTQVGIVENAYRRDEVLSAIRALLEKARTTQTPVIYVQHEEPEGYELEVGTPPWEIHPSIAPREGEPVVHKRASDSFYDTTFQQVLKERGIQTLVVVGAQTEYCVDTTIRRATTQGYNVLLVEDAHTTFDSGILTAEQIIAHTNNTLNGFRSDNYRILVKPAEEIAFS